MAKINIERYFEENNGMLFPAEFTISLDSSDQGLMDEISVDYNLLTVEPGQDKIIVSLPSKRSMIEGAADQINDLIDRIRLSWENAGDNIGSAENDNFSGEYSPGSEYAEDYQLIYDYSGSDLISKLEPEKSSLRDRLSFKSSFRVGSESSGDEISENTQSAGDKLNFPVLKRSSPLSPSADNVGDSVMAEETEGQDLSLSIEYEDKSLLPVDAEAFGYDELSDDSETDNFLNIDELTGISDSEESGNVPLISDDDLFRTDVPLSDSEQVLQNSGLVLPDLPPDASDFLSSGVSDPLDSSLLSELSFNPEDISDDDEFILDDSLSSVIPEDTFSGEFPDESADEDFSDLNAAPGDESLSESDVDMGAEDFLRSDSYFGQESGGAESLVLPDLPDSDSEELSSEVSDSEIISGLIPDIADLDDLSTSIDFESFEGLDVSGDEVGTDAGFADIADVGDIADIADMAVDGGDIDLPALPEDFDDPEAFDNFEGIESFENFEGLDVSGDEVGTDAGFADMADVGDIADIADMAVDGGDIDLPALPSDFDDPGSFDNFEGIESFEDFEVLDVSGGEVEADSGFADMADVGDIADIADVAVDGGDIDLHALPSDFDDPGAFDDFEGFEDLDVSVDFEGADAGSADVDSDSLLPDFSDDFTDSEGSSESSDTEFIVEESGGETGLSVLPELSDSDNTAVEGFSGDKVEYFRNLTEKNPSDPSGWSGLGSVLAKRGMTEEAEYAFTQAVNLDSGDEDALTGLFYIFKGKKSYSEAVEFINVLIRKKPWDSSLLYDKAIVEEMAGNNDVAERELKKAVILDHENTLAWAKLALLLIKRGRNDEALECYSELTKLKPGVSEVWYSKGLVLKSLLRNDEALSSFEKCLEINPSDNDALKEKAGILLAEGNYSEAVQEYENAVKSDPKSIWALFGLASSYEKSGHNEKAVNIYDKILEINPAEVSALENKAELLLKSHLFAEAKDAYVSISSLEPDNPEIWLTIAKLSENSGQFDESMLAYNRALKLDPTSQDGLRGRIRVLVSQGKYEEALPDYNFLIIQNPSDASLIADKAIACIRTGMPDEAIVLYNAALNLDRKNTKILMELIDLLTSLGRLEEALPVYDRLISLMPEETDLLLSKGLILAGVKRHREAVSCFNRVLAKKRDDPEVMLNLGISLLCLGEKEKALRCYKKSLEANPEFGNRWLESGINAASFLMAKEVVIPPSPESYRPKRDSAERRDMSESKPDLSVRGHDYPYDISEDDLDKYARELSDGKISSERSVPRSHSIRFEEDKEKDPNELVRKGIELTKSGFYDIAEKSLLQALVIDDYNESGYFSLGVLYGKTARFAEAIDCFEKVLMINPSNKKAGRGIIMARNKI
ncbi:tetratricopeptide repeat protein [Methanoplanus endosymbiosus]|uniref:Tetratricopeptide repeat protein n=1 Tax=Methanoplanus endosymbiosus TaxID=33865 RepID=A0A9E7PNY9_9EURY|nr:tetratricopeptide repeat protein [Methanoplanus endosymbiosus]UUX93769.1 tetratricopeptide repeat protein [Methanoplanus endosymbiosus]